jgi:hypothetical protein
VTAMLPRMSCQRSSSGGSGQALAASSSLASGQTRSRHCLEFQNTQVTRMVTRIVQQLVATKPVRSQQKPPARLNKSLILSQQLASPKSDCASEMRRGEDAATLISDDFIMDDHVLQA